MYRHVHSKETYSLRVTQLTVQQVGKGGNKAIVIDQVITHHTKLNPKNVQTCPFEGNLLAESAPVHSTRSTAGDIEFTFYDTEHFCSNTHYSSTDVMITHMCSFLDI